MLLISNGIPLIYHMLNKTKKTYNDQLFDNVGSVDFACGVFSKLGVVDGREQFSVFLVIEADHQRRISVSLLEHVEALKELHLELAAGEGNLLRHARFQLHLLDVVVLIGRVHHRRHVVHVSLLSHTRVHSDVTFTQRVHLEGYLQSLVSRQVLPKIH